MRTALGRPLRSQEAARKLLLAAITVPEPRGCLWVGDGALTLSAALPKSQDLQQRWITTTETAAREQLMSMTAESLAQLHRGGYSHGDCKWSNLVCCGEQLYLVDLDAVRRATPGSRHQARDLARFTLNAEELAVDSGNYRVFLEVYFSLLAIPREAIIAQMLPELHRLRDRHRGRYGERGRALW
jgi:tRNA A-37 threonylcarbamoyl transferase component Bud32